MSSCGRFEKAGRITTAVILSFLFAVSASGDCRGDKDSQLLRNYDGTIGDTSHVRMTITVNDHQIKGVYCYASQLMNITLRGRIFDGSRFVIDAFDSSERSIGRFDGEFPAKDPRGKFGDSELQCEVMVGSWYARDRSSEKLPFYLTLESETGGTLENRYSVAGAADDKLIDRNAQRFWEAVKRGDKYTVGTLVKYPITIYTKKGYKKIRNAESLIRNYDVIFTPDYVDAISKAIPKNMFVRDQGIMLGAGEVWFGPDGKVITLNNF